MCVCRYARTVRNRLCTASHSSCPIPTPPSPSSPIPAVPGDVNVPFVAHESGCLAGGWQDLFQPRVMPQRTAQPSTPTPTSSQPAHHWARPPAPPRVHPGSSTYVRYCVYMRTARCACAMSALTMTLAWYLDWGVPLPMWGRDWTSGYSPPPSLPLTPFPLSPLPPSTGNLPAWRRPAAPTSGGPGPARIYRSGPWSASALVVTRTTTTISTFHRPLLRPTSPLLRGATWHQVGPPGLLFHLGPETVDQGSTNVFLKDHCRV